MEAYFGNPQQARADAETALKVSAKRLHDGGAAAVEFRKVIDHPWHRTGNLVGALAHLGLARAYALRGEKAKSRTAYQDFLALWKDADPDIPILKQAKAEYAKLH